ncbi:MAG: hypothetical protein IT422_05135 [Pirellulaceae bacterium]|nr:hypothetical protein [Pirellulaceae bacterium]
MADSSSDFFEYGRGYALYSQGMTDVGRKFAKDPITGKEVDAPEPELIKAAIERDTLLIARAAGSDLTLNEYKNLHDSVAFLQRQYRDQKITNATYQEKLWSLPGRAKRERTEKKTTHYTPSRDAKTGEPKAGKPDADVASVPIETMRKLSPEIGDMPKTDFKEFWDSVVERAGVDPAQYGSTSAGFAERHDRSGPRPPGDGDVEQRSGAPPVQLGASSNDPSPPASGGKRGGWLDQLQSGLDAIGIVEPTPFADGINAGISGMRALADPKNAGKHLRNAGISLVSAFVPYVGDAAKLAKYGDKIDPQTKAGRMLASLGLGGGGSDGGGGSGGDGSGSSGSRSDSGAGGLIEGALGAIGNLARAMGPVGFAVAGVVLGLKAFVTWMGKVDEAARKTIEGNRHLAQYSGGLAGSYATLDNQRLLRDIERGQQLTGPLGRLTGAQSANEAARQDLFLPFQKPGVDMQAFFVNISTYAIQIIDYLEPISELLQAWYGEEKDKNLATSAAQYMAREANERMAKRRL